MDIIITNMIASDVPKVAELEKQCFSMPWSEQAFYDELENKLAVYFTAKMHNECVGYAGFWNVSGEGGITNVAVRSDFRRHGIGSMLIEAMIKAAYEMRLDILTLEVRKSNMAARCLYEKYGFVPIGFRKRYYSEPEEDALIMTKIINEDNR